MPVTTFAMRCSAAALIALLAAPAAALAGGAPPQPEPQTTAQDAPATTAPRTGTCYAEPQCKGEVLTAEDPLTCKMGVDGQSWKTPRGTCYSGEEF